MSEGVQRWVALVSVVALGTSVGVVGLARTRDGPAASALAVTGAGVSLKLLAALWVGLGAATLHASAVDAVASVLVVIGWVALIAHYLGAEWAVERPRLALLAAPLVLAAGVQSAQAITGGDAVTAAQFRGIESAVTAYSYALIGATVAALLARVARERPIYRRRTALLAAAPLPPALLAAAYMAEGVPLDANLTPVGYAVSTLVAVVGVRRFGALDILPVAHRTMIDSIEDGVLALTDGGVVASVNDPARGMLGLSDDAVGRELSDALSAWPGIVDAVASGGGDRLEVDGRHVQVSLTPIETGGVALGTVVQLRDVTREVERREEIEAQRRQLERTNEQLNEFASVVSHDIRNPLAIARGRLDEVAAETGRTEAVEAVEDAHERIDAIVDDLLHLARQGRAVSDPEPVDFEAVAREARSVAAPDAALEFRGPETVTGDRSRVRQLLENLFRNAAEHGGGGVTIRIGPLDGRGFYVADDGPGVPEAERDRVFEHGYSGREGGTGLGLAIVRSVAEAHGWSVRVTDGIDGGARFEFDGVGSAAAATPAEGDA